MSDPEILMKNHGTSQHSTTSSGRRHFNTRFNPTGKHYWFYGSRPHWIRISDLTSTLLRWPNGYRTRFPSGGPGFDPQKGQDSGQVLLNHSLTIPRCRNGTSKCGENWKVPPLSWDCMKVTNVPITSR